MDWTPRTQKFTLPILHRLKFLLQEQPLCVCVCVQFFLFKKDTIIFNHSLYMFMLVSICRSTVLKLEKSNLSCDITWDQTSDWSSEPQYLVHTHPHNYPQVSDVNQNYFLTIFLPTLLQSGLLSCGIVEVCQWLLPAVFHSNQWTIVVFLKLIYIRSYSFFKQYIIVVVWENFRSELLPRVLHTMAISAPPLDEQLTLVSHLTACRSAVAVVGSANAATSHRVEK